MCGIAGIVNPVGQPVLTQSLQKMGHALDHRGPDSGGQWSQSNIGFAHQRLSIIDLSSEGHQPMVSQDGRYVLTYNGEIYNFKGLRESLPRTPYRGHSDTEVLLNALIEWGVERTVSSLIGMFAFAFYDTQAQTLFLVRDRLGIKPIYYGWHQDQFLFASELSAVEAAVDQRPTISADALALMMRHNHVPAPYCIYENFFKLPPASILKVDTSASPTQQSNSPQTFWSPQKKPSSTTKNQSDAAWQAEFHEQLRESVRARLVSDVPLGGFLSGGIDSTLIVALMQEQSEQRISTYTIGFNETEFNEAQYAQQTAQHLGTNHHELYLNEQDVLDSVAKLNHLCDEPFADQSILPTYLLCDMAKKDVTVALTGDGGDEILWGYSRYPARERLEKLRNRIPSSMRPLTAQILSSKLLARTLGALPTPSFLGRASTLANKLQTASEIVAISDEDQFYMHLMSHWKDPTSLISGSKELSTHYSAPPQWTKELPIWQRMSTLDLLAYLPNDCLTKVDRASMAVGLEARVPLLDHRVVELAYQLPENLIRQGGVGKIILRNILDQYVPRSMMDRPKSGFGVPLGQWLRGPLKEWTHDLLSTQSLSESGLFNTAMVNDLHQQHQQGTADWSAYLWDVLMFLNWNQAR